MSWSIKLFTLAGTAVRMHLTFLLLVAWIAAMQWMRGSAADALYGVLFILVLFAWWILRADMASARPTSRYCPSWASHPWSACLKSPRRRSSWRWRGRRSTR